MFDGYTETAAQIEARRRRILTTMPQPWNPTLDECLELEAQERAAKAERSRQIWAEFMQEIEGIKAGRAQA